MTSKLIPISISNLDKENTSIQFYIRADSVASVRHSFIHKGLTCIRVEVTDREIYVLETPEEIVRLCNESICK